MAFFAQWVSVFHFKANWLFQICLNKNLQSKSKEKKIKYWNIFQNNMMGFFSGRDLVLNPVRIEKEFHVCFGIWKAMLLLPPGYQFRNLQSSKIVLFGPFPLETFERTAVTLNMCSHKHESRGGLILKVILPLQCLPCLPGKHTPTHKMLEWCQVVFRTNYKSCIVIAPQVAGVCCALTQVKVWTWII